jgi:hypothetical protein
MVLIGSLRSVAGLALLGVVIALGVWLLSRLFPGTPTVSRNSHNNTAPAAFHGPQTMASAERRQDKPSGVAQEHDGPPNNDE